MGELEVADCGMSSHHSSSQDDAMTVTSRSDVDTRKWREVDMKKNAKEERHKEEREGVKVMVWVDIFNRVMPVYMKEGFTIRQAIFAVSTLLVACNADLEKFIMSVGSCYCAKTEHWEIIGDTALSTFATEAKEGDFPVVVHFDRKQMNQDFGGRRETLAREGMVVTSPYMERDVPVDETGYAVATEMFGQLVGLDIVDQVVMEVADTRKLPA